MTTRKSKPPPEVPPDGTPIIQRNTDTGQLRIIWPETQPESVSMSTEAVTKMVTDFNDFRTADALAISMLEDYRNRRSVGIERWAALQKVRRRLGLK
jgi:hypothetical protein